MFGSPKRAAQAYASVGLESGVAAASPHRLISMLFDGAMIATTRARQHMEDGLIAEKGQAISKAITIIDSGLRGGLNTREGGDLARQLENLYGYMTMRLTEANLKNQPEMLTEVHSILRDLKSAWDTIDPAPGMVSHE